MFPMKYGRTFFLKAFHGRWGTIYWGDILHGELMIRSCKGWRSFTNTFFSNCFLIFPIMKRYKLEDKAMTKIMEVFILEVNS